MFAFFGLGTQELFILAAMGGTLLLGILAAVVLISRVSAGTRERAVVDEEFLPPRAESDREKGPPG